MRISQFVTASSVVLLAWLALSYSHHVPVRQKSALAPSLSAKPVDAAAPSMVEVSENDDFSVSVSP